MNRTLAPLHPLPDRRWLPTAAAFLLACGMGMAGWQLIAQVEGDRGIAPVAATGDITATGIVVDVTGKNAEDARAEGWQQAQRLAWSKLGGGAVSDGELDAMVSAIIVEKEQIGLRRYIATLGVVFDRTKAGARLGAGGPITRSAPLMVLPVLESGGTATVFEVRNPWQKAWAEFQAGASAIDYVRPSGAGGESLLLTQGQTGRRSRLWWRTILDEFGAADVIMPVARLQRQWPGGPVQGTFTARYGPDNRFLESFTLSAANEDGVPRMLNQAITRFDAIFTRALQQGLLKPDPTLAQRPELDPALAALIDLGRRAEAGDKAVTDAIISGSDGSGAPLSGATAQVVASFTVQFATPDAAAVDGGLGSVRGTPGVRGAATSSIAIGGVSVMNVSYAGNLADLAAALRARGWKVTEGRNALSIRK